MAGYLFALVAALVLPLGAALYLSRRLGTVKPVLLGALTFFVFQGLLRIPLLQFVLPRSTAYTLFQFTRPGLFLVFLSLTAGLFEEIGRYLVMKKFMAGAPAAQAVAFGIGHGGIEAILLVGVNLVLVASTGAFAIGPASGQFLAAGVERITAMVFHVCLTLLVWRALAQPRRGWLALAILLHTLLNVLAGFLSLNGAPIALIEGALALATALFLLYTIVSLRRPGHPGSPGESLKGVDHGTYQD